MGMVVNMMTGSVSKAVERKETHGHILNYPLFITGAGTGRFLNVSPASFDFNTNDIDGTFDITSNVSWLLEYD